MRGRLTCVVLLFALWMGTLGARLYRIQIVEHEQWTAQAGQQQVRQVELTPPRGAIFDRRGRTLAVSSTVESAFIEKPNFKDPTAVAEAIAAVVTVDSEALAARLAGGRWSWVARQLTPAAVDRLKALEIEGLLFVEESKRFYPLESLAGPVLGIVGVDHVGLAGLEAGYDEVVSGESVRRPVLQDALRRRAVAPKVSFLDAKPGADLRLTIDAAIQHIVERELRRALAEHSATAATAVLMDPRSGAVLAMASVPSFDPNRFAEFPAAQRRNRVIQDAYEPGSTFKLVTAAAVLERNLVDPMDLMDCGEGSITLERTRIRDHKPFGVLSFRDVVTKSSNVGAIKLGLTVGAPGFSEQIAAFEFGEPTGVDLPGESIGIVRPVERWARHEVAYAAIGQGISVTPLQLARAFAAVASGGYLLRPHVVAAVGSRGQARGVERRGPVLSAATVRTLLRMLEAVVEDGTGRLAAVPGYRVAGKTGTAQIAVPGVGYASDRYVASFAGFVPSRAPRLVGVVTVMEPAGRYHGGEVAAPLFAAILRQTLPLLGVVPERSQRLAEQPGDRPATAIANRRTSERSSVPAALIPDFVGLTLREALRLAADRGLDVRLEGSGIVAQQTPPVGSARAHVGNLVTLKLAGGRMG